MTEPDDIESSQEVEAVSKSEVFKPRTRSVALNQLKNK